MDDLYLDIPAKLSPASVLAECLFRMLYLSEPRREMNLDLGLRMGGKSELMMEELDE